MKRKWYAPLLLWFMDTKLYVFLLKKVIPYIRFSMYYTTMKGWKYKRGYKLLKPGHFLLTLDRAKLTGFLIPGDVTHAVFCVGKGDDVEWETSEMTHEDYTKSTFFDVCKESDRVLICECTDWDEAYTKQVIERVKSLQQAKYDTKFVLNSLSAQPLVEDSKFGFRFLACSELIYEGDFEHRLQVSLEDVAGLGRPYISPVGLLKGKNVRVVWDSDKEVRGW